MTSNETTALLAEDLIVNPALVLLQRRLSASNYDGPGKWAIFDASTRKSLLAVEQVADFEQGRIATVLRLLLSYSAAPGLHDDAAQKLAEAGLLVRGADDARMAATFVARFQQSVFDYPFYNYSSPLAFREDRELMASYADQAPPPPSWTDRGSSSIDLPDVVWDDLDTLRSTPFGLRHLAAVLRFTFGPIAEIQSLGSVMHYRRTGPSGGAKHPTECWLNIATSWEGLAPGLYAYDCEYHALVRVDDPELRFSDRIDGQPWSISVRSRVERPMWRYRDSRSFRAVLIDAGHVIETLNLLLGHFGMGAAVHRGGRPAHGAKWLREPEVAVIVPDLLASAPPPENRATAAAPEPHPGMHDEEALVTNPAMYFTIEGGRFRGHIVHPQNRSFSADETDFAILTTCILSHRGRPFRPGDRHTTPNAIIDTIKGATGDRIASLIQRGALLKASEGGPLYSEIRRWAEHGWYQPALAWMEAANSRPSTAGRPNRARTFSAGCDLGDALQNRVTTRAFSNEPISRGTLTELVSEAFAVDSGQTDGVRCLAAAFNVTGCEPNRLWRWDNDSKTLTEKEATTVTAADLVNMTIGQKWLQGCAAAIWLVTRIDADNPASYLTANVMLGRMAQSVCVLGTDRGLGVFQTPAIEDRKFIAKMGIAEDLDMIAYLVCVGRPRRENRAPK